MPSHCISAADLLRHARKRAELSQVELSRRAGVPQSVISMYESGARQPSIPVLSRLVAATGHELELRVRRAASPLWRLRGPLGERVRTHRSELKRLAAASGTSNLRVFGSVARGEDSEVSDVDLLVDLSPETGLFKLMRLQGELEVLLQARVDLVPVADLKPDVRDEVMAELVAL